MLVVMGFHLLQRGIARPLVEFIQERVLPLACVNGVGLGFREANYVKCVSEYELALQRIEGSPVELMSPSDRHAAGQRILNGDLGFDYVFALNPVRIQFGEIARASGKGEPATPSREVQRSAWLQQWGMNMISLGGHEGPPPHEVWSGTNLWAFDPSDRYAKRWAPRFIELDCDERRALG